MAFDVNKKVSIAGQEWPAWGLLLIPAAAIGLVILSRSKSVSKSTDLIAPNTEPGVLDAGITGLSAAVSELQAGLGALRGGVDQSIIEIRGDLESVRASARGLVDRVSALGQAVTDLGTQTAYQLRQVQASIPAAIDARISPLAAQVDAAQAEAATARREVARQSAIIRNVIRWINNNSGALLSAYTQAQQQSEGGKFTQYAVVPAAATSAAYEVI